MPEHDSRYFDDNKKKNIRLLLEMDVQREQLFDDSKGAEWKGSKSFDH